jgi:transcriptional regulator GlxA family with amidase domain
MPYSLGSEAVSEDLSQTLEMCGLAISDEVRQALLFEERPGQGTGCPIPSTRHGDLTNRHLQRAFEIMQTHLEDPLSQTQVARHCRLSVRQLQRLFSNLIGETFHQAYMRLRLDRAYQLLKQTDMPIVEIAVACGFSNGSYFAQAARRRWNMTPSRVRSRPEAYESDLHSFSPLTGRRCPPLRLAQEADEG